MLQFIRYTMGELGDRLRSTPSLQRIVERVHQAGPRATGEMLIELLEHADADPAVLDRLHRWSTIESWGADRAELAAYRRISRMASERAREGQFEG